MPIDNATILRHRLRTEWQAWVAIVGAIVTFFSVFYFVGPYPTVDRVPKTTRTEYLRVESVHTIYSSGKHVTRLMHYITVFRIQGKLMSHITIAEYKKGQLLQVKYTMTPSGDISIQDLHPADEIAESQR